MNESSTKSAAEFEKPRIRAESFQSVKSLLRYLVPYRLRLSAAIVAQVISTGFGLSFPYLTGLLLDSAVGDSVSAGWESSLHFIAALLLGSLALNATFSFFSTYWFYCCGERALVDLRKDIFARLIRMPMAFFAERSSGELTSRLTSDLTLIQDSVTMTIQQVLRQSLLLFGGLTLVLLTSPGLTLLMLCTFPVLVLLAILFGRGIRKLARKAQDHMAAGVGVIEESLQGIASVKAYGNEVFECRRYDGFLDDFLKVIVRTALLRALMVSFIIFGIFGSIVLVFWYGAVLMRDGGLSFGELTRFILYTTFIGGSVASFADAFGHIQKMLGATERVRDLLEEEPEASEVIGKPPNPPRLHGSLRFESVDFSYPSRRELPVLSGVNLQASPGEKIALVGASGAGKSTVVSLLLRFYDPTSGNIRIDDYNLNDLPLSSLRSNLAVVPQEVLLFGGTIAENIAYGRPGATDEEIRQAAALAACNEFLERLPDGLATRVGDRGTQLSGGQRQRIAIARAILRDPAILILDEATSALDSQSELLVQQALDNLLRNRTAVIIAHRLSTVRKASRIYVLHHGAVVETGTHDELMVLEKGVYRKLAAIQFDPS